MSKLGQQLIKSLHEAIDGENTPVISIRQNRRNKLNLADRNSLQRDRKHPSLLILKATPIRQKLSNKFEMADRMANKIKCKCPDSHCQGPTEELSKAVSFKLSDD